MGKLGRQPRNSISRAQPLCGRRGFNYLPLLLTAARFMGRPNLIIQAGMLSGALFIGLTVVVFTTKKDFSFLRGMLKIGGKIALGLIAASFFFGGLNLGTWSSGAMILFAGGSILY